MKEIVNKTDKFVVYRDKDTYRVHFYDDERLGAVDKFKSFITKNIEKVKRFL